jgi:ZIP family zinc transporter
MSLLYVGKATRRRRASIGPGAMAFAETAVGRRQEALALAMSIAAGIGLHNFSEGLAIGQAAHADEMSLALLLVVGFGLHNATEGFGIVGPLVAAEVRPTWGWLALAGLVAGGPTFVGTIIGNSFSSEYVFVAFLTLAAGAILYVLGELFSVGRKLSWEVTLWGVLIGFLLGLATELVIVAAGA